jgi:hypothetical protein
MLHRDLTIPHMQKKKKVVLRQQPSVLEIEALTNNILNIVYFIYVILR